MKIIGAGLGRTGSLSLAKALEGLGYGPCYHMIEVLTAPKQSLFWLDAVAGKTVNWQSFFKKYQSGIDYPYALFYRDIFNEFPEAKVILSIRDFDRWYDSTLETIYQGSLYPKLLTKIIPALRAFVKMEDVVIWDGFFEGKFEEREFAIGKFKAYIAEVKATVPPEQLLVYSVKEGWEPLCLFLNVPIPNEPFPHVNSRRRMKGAYMAVRIIGGLVTFIILSGVYYLLFM